MKLNSPFFLFLFLVLTCCENKPTATAVNPINDSIAILLKKAADTSLGKMKQTALSYNAYHLAEKTADKNMIFYTAERRYNLLLPFYPDSTDAYLRDFRKAAYQTDKWIPKAYYNISLADHHFSHQKYFEAFEAYNTSKSYYAKERDSIGMGCCLMKMAIIQQTYNDYYGSESNATEALKCFNSAGNMETYLKEVHNILGISYTGLKNYPSAINAYKKSLKLTTDEQSKKITQNNLAYIYILNKDFNKAIVLLNEIVHSETLKTDTISSAMVLDNLGYAQFRKNKAFGFPNMSEALQLRETNNYLWALPSSYLHISEYYLERDTNKALNFAVKAYNAATKANSIDDRMESMQWIVKIDKNYFAKKYSETYFRLKDSIEDLRQKATNRFALLKYNTAEAGKTIKSLTKDKAVLSQKAKKIIIISITVVVFLLLCMLFYYYLNKAKHEKEKLKEIYNTETRIAKKLHDELANDVFNTMSFATVKDLSDEQNKEQLLDNLENIYHRTRNVSKENSTIDTGPNFEKHLKELLTGFNDQQINVLQQGLDNIRWINLNENTKVTVYRIIQELLVNMKKHSQCNLAVFAFELSEHLLKVTYNDNGIGIRHSEQKSGNGLQNVENRIRAMHGTFTFENESEKGFRFSFTIPIKK